MRIVKIGELLPTDATARRAMMITGIAEIASRIRITIMSKMPLKYPAASPMDVPTAAPRTVARKEITTISLAPTITLEKIS